MVEISFYRFVGWLVVSIISSLSLALILSSYVSLTFLHVFSISLLSHVFAYILLISKLYSIKTFYFLLIITLIFGIFSKLISSVSFSFPDPKTYAAAYIVFGTLLGILISIAFLYVVYGEE